MRLARTLSREVPLGLRTMKGRSALRCPAAEPTTLMSNQPEKPIEEIVREVGRYPLDAYHFVQECIGLAAERVHGPMSADQTAIAHWMAKNKIGPEELIQQREGDELPAEIAEALERVGGPSSMNRHVTGQELCWVIRDVALGVPVP